MLLQRNTLYEGHYLDVCLLFPGSDAVWQLSLTEIKVLWDERDLTCGDLELEQYTAESCCFPESWFWMCQVWRWSVQTGYLCLTAGSTAFEFPFPSTCCLVTIAYGSVRVEINMWLVKKCCRPIQQSKHLLLKLFRAQRCVDINITHTEICLYACRFLVLVAFVVVFRCISLLWMVVKGVVEPWKDVGVGLFLHIPHVMKLHGRLFNTMWSSEYLICGLSCI